ncbi:hypothetical protein C8J57DRAFT_1340862 [Mycena rebaudengoi]|nr:hypothetical protein C8J57DRAFT_1340862 [Mycena rebaudengoi]
MSKLRRFDSDTTHVSDSEPERQAARAKMCKSHKSRTTPGMSSARCRTQPPFSDRSNFQEDCRSAKNERNLSVEARLSRIEGACRFARAAACCTERLSSHPRCQTPPSPQHRRSTVDKCVGGDIPIGALDSPLVALSSFEDAVRVEVRRQLAGAHEALDEIIEQEIW